MTLRARLLATLVACAVLPVLGFSWAVSARLERRMAEAEERRLAASAAAVRQGIERSRQSLERALARVAAALSGDAPGAGASLQPLAEGQGLDVLEALAADGRLLASHHWPAGYDLPDDDRVLDAELGLRLQKIAEGHGFVERLTLTVERDSAWQGRPARLRGGVLVGAELLAEWGSASGADVAIVGAGARWARPGSPLESATLARAEAGTASIEPARGGPALRWASRRLGPQLVAVAGVQAAPASDAGELLQWSLGFAALAGLLGAAAALALQAAIVRPLEQLSQAAQRVAAGELSAGVPVTGADEVAELGRSFNEMVDDLRRAQLRLVQAGRAEVWRDLARRLAHELKNPLFPIQISVETLRRAYEAGGPESPQFRGLFEDLTATLLAELQSLRRIVEGFAGFARIPEPKLQPTDLNALVERVLDLQAAAAVRVKVERSFQRDLPPVPADADLLARAVANLVANAIEAMPQGGVLRVATRALPRRVEIVVSDTGPGLDEQQKQTLFRPYHTTKPGGTGLGLVIAQSIVSDHRGELDVQSEPGRGATFLLRLPLREAP
jgi:signal transduction histidine kinase